MATDLEIRIGAELTEIKNALGGLKKDLAAVGQAAQQASGNKAFDGIAKSAQGAIGTVTRLVGAFFTVQAALRAIRAADELNTLNARLKLVTNSAEEFARAQEALFELATRTRSSLGETINLYTRIAQATKDAGVGQEVLLGVVETINQAVQLSGASTQAAEAALVQLGQGLASGTLRGEELNSVLEQTPALADAIAKGLGKTRGELRQLGSDGKLTAQAVIEALQKQRDVVAQQFASLPLTVGQAVTLLGNAGQKLLGTFDTVSGATGGLARVIKDLADFLNSDAVQGAVIEFAATWSGAFEQIVGDAKEAVRIIRSATTDIVGSGEDLIDILGRAFRELPANIRASIQIVTVQAAALFDRLVSYATFVKDNFKAIFTDDTQDASFARFQARNQAIADAAQATIDDALAQRQKTLDDARKVREAADEVRRLARRPRADGFSPGKFKTVLTAEQKAAAAAEAKARLDAEEKLLKDSIERSKDFYQGLYEDAKLSATDYFQTRQALELRALDKSIEIEQRRKAQATNGADRVKAETEITLLERAKADLQAKFDRDKVQRERETKRQLDDLRAQDLDSQGKTAEAAAIRLEAQFRDLRARLVADGNTAGVELIDRLIDSGKAKARFDEIKTEFDRVLGDLQRRQQQLADQVSTGAISPAIGSAEQSEARQQAARELDALNAKLQELARNTNDPAIKQGAAEATEALRRLAIDGATGLDRAVIDLRSSLAKLQEGFAQSAAGAGVDALENLFTSIGDGSKSAGEKLRDFVRGFAASMAQIAARALATFLVLQLLEAIFPGAGKLVAASGSVTAGVKHSGGMVGGGGAIRAVNPLVFAGAPRYHSGGLVGLKPDERPAILQTGEEVLSRDDPRNAANGGGVAAMPGTKIVNVIDPELAGEYLTSPKGERTFLNLISRNAPQIRNLIG